MTMPTILEVPYSEKEQAKSLGAKWNPEKKKWYVPAGIDLESFRKSIPVEHPENEIRALPPIYIVESPTKCWRCGISIPVVALASQGFVDGAEPMQIQAFMRRLYPKYFKDYSRTTHSRYFMNHCSCGAKLGDFYMHS